MSFEVDRRWAVAPLAMALMVTGCGSGGEDLPPVGGSQQLQRLRAALRAPGAHQAFVPESPPGLFLDESMIPEDNPLTPAKVALGKQLYHDPRLSRDGSTSCASCHAPSMGFTDQAPVSTGIHGQKGGRSAPTVINRVMGLTQFWDGRAASLEEQALGPIGNPIEMGFSPEEAAARLAEIPGYVVQFQAVFGGPPTPDGIAKAIASFERTVLSGGAPNDYYERAKPFLDSDEEGDEDDPELAEKRKRVLADWEAHKMSDAALRGREIYFEKGKCSLCHVGPNLADERFHNLGVGMDKTPPDLGREEITKQAKDRGGYKTPTLRNIADTAPYMHDGSQATLEEVVAFYNKGGHPNPHLSNLITPLDLTPAEEADLVTFLKEGLQGTVTQLDIPELPESPDPIGKVRGGGR